ncbi:uncharacterized protein LOC115884070 isoform X2 [Sitophilus oryzae]|uniref:Uncharacterized protein LOC115884070 isoform X2 n=1 Tax=Sitophilus oryzae TaxID=7048 RepID=A0A6J2Y5S9_SITOR|nr:uncharacterized protein LOC115884070 isoform X2 [Sitophilus oryzae]
MDLLLFKNKNTSNSEAFRVPSMDLQKERITEIMEINLKKHEEIKKNNETQMTSSTISTISSLASPVDSGVQMLDSECELTSVMSGGSGCENDVIPNIESDNRELASKDTVSTVVLNKKKPNDLQAEKELEKIAEQNLSIPNLKENEQGPGYFKLKHNFTKSDFVNKNVIDDKLSHSVPTYFDQFSDRDKDQSDDVFEMEHPIKSSTETDLMNISLNSYELLDYTLQNTTNVLPEYETIDMHVSLSEEVNENLKVNLDGKEFVPPAITENISVIESPETKPAEEQIVFRRQRKKKSKSDTPKKRVSFHEDILNSTKIDDIHINLGFITHEPDVSLSFFQRGFVRKPDVVKGRYSWAAEGDAPFYEKANTDREIKSDIYIHHPRYSSTSSSSTGSVTSSIDEEDSASDENIPKKEPTQKMPKSSCLKKTKNKKYINTDIVQEELTKKKCENNLLDNNIFGSLKNILNFSTSVPLAKRGVPEGQEDVTIYSSSHDISNRRKSFGSFSFENTETVEVAEVKPEPINKIHVAKNNLKLTKSEGFYPNYQPNRDLPANIILCDNQVYEHKGISYSYEYDNFQKAFEQQNKPKSSVIYQKILKELNFFRRKAKDEPEKEAEEDFEIINQTLTPTNSDVLIEEVSEVEVKESDGKLTCSTPKNNMDKFISSVKLDWSDNETVSDLSESRHSRHLDSPKKKVLRNNHYTICQSPLKVPLAEYKSLNQTDASKSLPNLRTSTSKSSLINRFLRNVTLKKMVDIQTQGYSKKMNNCIGLYVKGCKVAPTCNKEIDQVIENEIICGKKKQITIEYWDKITATKLRKQIFRNKEEKLLKVYPIRSAYATNGDSIPLLLILTDITLYVTSLKHDNVFCNHFILPYTDLNAVLIGPNAQVLHISNNNLDMQCMLTTGCSKIANDIVSHLEVAMRRDLNKPKLPAIKHLTMRDMVNLRKAICKQTAVDKDEEYYYYSVVNIQDSGQEDVMQTPLGPTKEGPLMFKIGDIDYGRWETAYFILKAGVLYMLSSASQGVPMRIFPLINGACQGARRVFNCQRPHTFQVIIEGKDLHLAAPDEYVASEWLQELIHSASGMCSYKEKKSTYSCSLLMTGHHILTIRESFPSTVNLFLPQRSKHEPIQGPQALSCAAITDLLSFRLPSAEQSWCVMEFSCREVHEYSGDWIVYFSTNAELETFISTLEMLWQYSNDDEESFPLSTIPETDPLSKKCVDIYSTLIKTWPPNTVHLQYFRNE